MLDDVFAGWDSGLVAADAHAAYERADFRTAADLYRRALQHAPDDADLATRLSSALLLSNRYEEGLEAGQAAMRIAPDAPAPAVFAAGCARATGDIDTAIQLADEALRRDPDDVAALLCKADVLRTAGEAESADALLRQAAQAHPREPNVLMELAAHARTHETAGNLPEQLNSLSADESLHLSLRAALLYALGALHERLEEYQPAFDAFERANAAAPPPPDPAGMSRVVDEIISAWSRERYERLPIVNDTDPPPIFIVGMPRTGSTLVEQILACHPSVHAGGEMPHFGKRAGAFLTPPLAPAIDALTRDALSNEARAHLADLASLAPGTERVTDKLLSNFLHLGVARALFPDAPIIHCVRRPLDTALSCWQHNFRGAVSWSNSFEGIAAFHHEHDRLMSHWNETVGLPLLTVAYEELVSAPEEWSRRLVEHAGLGWDEACLKPHENKRAVLTSSREQVREPVHTRAARRADRYGALLDPLRAALERAGVAPGA